MSYGNTVCPISTHAGCGSRLGPAAALLLGLTATFTAAADLAIIETRHRPAVELLGVVEPFVGSAGTATAKENKLIIDAPAATIATIRAIVETVDRPIRQLRISVRQGQVQQGRHDTRGGSISVGPNPDSGVVRIGGGADVTLGSEDWSIDGRVLSTTQSQRDQSLQQVTVVEGRSAHIFVGLDVPYANVYGAGGVLVQDTELRRVRTGFEVLPRLQGDQVTLEIAPIKESLQGQGRDIVSIQGLSTVVSGKLGEWIAAGAISREHDTQTRAILFRSGGALSDEQQIYFRAEEY